MICPKCGSQIPEDSCFCQNCGAPVTPPQPQQPAEQQYPSYEPAENAGWQNNPAPNAQTAYAMPPTEPPGKSGSKGLIITLSIVIPLVLLAGILVFLFRDTLFGGKGGEESGQEISSSMTDSSEPDAPASSKEEAPSEPAPPVHAKLPSPSEVAPAEEPALKDFTWRNQVKDDRFWAEGTPITEYTDYRGKWKAMVLYDPDHKMSNYAEELATVEIVGSPEEFQMRFDLHCIYWEFQPPEDETGTSFFFNCVHHPEINGFKGVFSGNELVVDHIMYRDGKEYLYGRLDLPKGLVADVLLMRP